MKFAYIALATAFSVYLAFGVGGRVLPQSPPMLVFASHALAIACLLSCALSLNHSRAACFLLGSAVALYTVLAFHDSAVNHADKIHLLEFTLELSCTVCGCLGAAIREDEEEDQHNQDMSLSTRREISYLANRPPGA